MRYVIPRSKIPGIITKSMGKRRAHGVRRYNRRIIAAYRRNPTVAWRPPESAPRQLSLLSWFIDPAKNSDGDCSNCGAFGAHPRESVLVDDKPTVLRKCRNCGRYFRDLPEVRTL